MLPLLKLVGFMTMLEAVVLVQVVVYLRMQRAVVIQVVLHPLHILLCMMIYHRK